MDEMQSADDVLDDNMESREEHDDYLIPDEVVTTSKIEIPEEFIPCKDKEAIIGTAFLSTGDVAQQLGIHRNLVINYTSMFYEYLAVCKNPMNNRYKYTQESVKQLAFIMNDRLNNNRTIKQELEFIQSKVGGKTMNMATRSAETIENLFNAMQENVIRSNQQFITESTNLLLKELQKSEQLRLESAEDDKTSLEKLEQRMSQQEELYKELVKELAEEKDKEIERLKSELQEKDEMLKKRKKRLFPW